MDAAPATTPNEGEKINVLAQNEERYTVKTKDGTVDQDIVNKYKESHNEAQ